MNYLAHALLAGPDPELQLGGLMGDFVKGPRESFDRDLSAGTIDGIELHRRIDSFADAHPAFRASRQRVSAGRRRYAGVMVDMFYDHLLARHWSRYCDQPLAAFAAQTYALMSAHQAVLPPRLRRTLPRMQAEDWLCAYAEPSGVGSALDGISIHRIRRANPLAGAVEELLAGYEGFESDFLAFMADAVVFAQRWRHSRGSNATRTTPSGL